VFLDCLNKGRKMIKKLAEYSYNNNLSHIPSALSMLSYLEDLFKNELVTPNDHIVLGKPFGAQAYYLLWEKYWKLDISNLSVGVKHDEIDFVDYSEETMGNALGVSAGIAMASDKLVWVNITDAALQMGNTLEAIQFIGHNRLNNIQVTVDYNNSQVTGKTSDILSVEPVIEFFRGCGWQVEKDLKYFGIGTFPKVFIMDTKKGDGIDFMEQNSKTWHYRKLDEEDIKQILKT